MELCKHHRDLILELFQHPQKKPPMHQQSFPIPILPSLSQLPWTDVRVWGGGWVEAGMWLRGLCNT